MRIGLSITAFRRNLLILALACGTLTAARAELASAQQLQPPVDMLIAPGTAARQALFASDPDGGPLQFTKMFGPDWMTFGPTFQMGTVSKTTMFFQPGVTDIETADVGVEVMDGSGALDQGFFQVSTVVPVRPASGSISFETPQLNDGRRTIDPFIDPGTGVVFRGATSGVEVGLVQNLVTSVCVRGDLQDQKLGAAVLGSDGIGISAQGCRADFGVPLPPPCTVSVEFQTGVGAVVELRLYGETGQEVASASGTAGPPVEPCFSFQNPKAILRLTATSQQAVSYAVMRQPSGTFVMVFDNFEYSSAPPPVTVEFDLHPKVIQLASHAPWVTGIIEPSGANPGDIDPSSLRLGGSVPPVPKFAATGDADGDGQGDLMVKFRREDLDPLLTPGTHELTLTGSLLTGESIEGTAEILVIDRGGARAASVAPNPLNPSGVLTFSTTKPGPVRVLLFDVRGALVRTLLNAPSLETGQHKVRFDGTQDDGHALPTGIYFYRIESADGAAGGRVAIVK